MLRIHFTSDDLARIRLAPAADPLWEVLLSLYRLRHPSGALYFGDWRQLVARRLRPSTQALTALAPPTGYAVDFLTPAHAGPSLDAGVETLLGTSRTRLRNDLEELARRHPDRALPGWTRALADGNPRALTLVTDAVTGHFTAALDPVWPQVQREVARDLDWRSQQLPTQPGGRPCWAPCIRRQPGIIRSSNSPFPPTTTSISAAGG